MLRKSDRIRADFATHRPSAGSNREGLVAEFLQEYLPNSVKITTGLVFASDGRFSDQADLIVVDREANAPLYGSSPEQIWLAEAVFALLEVKTNLTPSTISDAIEKCRKFKRLPRQFADTQGSQRIRDSLFILWAFEAPSHNTLKQNLAEAMRGVPLAERPDFVLVPGHSITRSGEYLRLSTYGQPNSAQFAERGQALQRIEQFMYPDQLHMLDVGPNAILVWLIWVQSWLAMAGRRRANLAQYVPADYNWGNAV